eukprot:3891489-Rhodomonas_salina.2
MSQAQSQTNRCGLGAPGLEFCFSLGRAEIEYQTVAEHACQDSSDARRTFDKVCTTQSKGRTSGTVIPVLGG